MKSSHWSKEEISSFCLELSLLLKAGFPVDVCFSILAEEEKDSKRIELFHQLHKKTEMGVSVYEAMKEADKYESEHGIVFNLFEIDENYDEVRRVY